MTTATNSFTPNSTSPPSPETKTDDDGDTKADSLPRPPKTKTDDDGDTKADSLPRPPKTKTDGDDGDTKADSLPRPPETKTDDGDGDTKADSPPPSPKTKTDEDDEDDGDDTTTKADSPPPSPKAKTDDGDDDPKQKQTTKLTRSLRPPKTKTDGDDTTTKADSPPSPETKTDGDEHTYGRGECDQKNWARKKRMASWARQRQQITEAADGGARARTGADGAVVLNLRRGPGAYALLSRADGQLTRAGQHYYSHLGLRPPSKDFDYNQPLIREGPNDYILLRNGQKKLVRSLQGGEHRLTKLGKGFFRDKYYEYLVHVPVIIRGRRRSGRNAGAGYERRDWLPVNELGGATRHPAHLTEEQVAQRVRQQVEAGRPHPAALGRDLLP